MMSGFSLNRRMLLQGAVLAATISPLRPAAAETQAAGVVSELRGEAVAELDDRRRELKLKSPIYLGETLDTGVKSRLRALLARKTTLRLGAKTRVRVDQFIVDAGGELVLDSGALLLDTSSGKFPEGLKVQSPFALIAVRGTRIFAGPIDGVFGVFVARGSVDVTAGNRTVRLAAGEGTDIARAGDPPGPVRTWGRPKIAKAMALVR
jgi:ferric-dicitrate binding protein FerR (iron transport regulator)